MLTAKLTYEIIMTLPEKEKDILFSMLEPHMKPLDLEELIDEAPMNKQEIRNYLLKKVFGKNKKSKL